MYLHAQAAPADTPIPGLKHATWAGGDEGLTQLSVWRQTLAPGAATPPHRHDCDEVILISHGSGELHVGGRVMPFDAPVTLTMPRNRMHQLINTGDTAMELVGTLAASPVQVHLPDDSVLPLPWRT